MKKVILIGLVFFFSFGCSLFQGDHYTGIPVEPFPRESSRPLPLSLSLELDNEVIDADDTQVFTVRLENQADTSVNIILGWDQYYEWHYDVVVATMDSQLVWDRLGNVIIQTAKELFLPPNSSAAYEYLWDGHYENSTVKVMKGRYLVWVSIEGEFGQYPDGRDQIGISSAVDTIVVR